jgi:hypothetical protein
MDIDPGKTVYVRLLVKFDQKMNKLGGGSMKYVVQLLPRGESQARMEMSDLNELEG